MLQKLHSENGVGDFFVCVSVGVVVVVVGCNIVLLLKTLQHRTAMQTVRAVIG